MHTQHGIPPSDLQKLNLSCLPFQDKDSNGKTNYYNLKETPPGTPYWGLEYVHGKEHYELFSWAVLPTEMEQAIHSFQQHCLDILGYIPIQESY